MGVNKFLKWVLILIGGLIALLVIAFVVFGTIGLKQEKQARANIALLSQEFSKGKSSVGFFSRAAELGADEFEVTNETDEKKPAKSNLHQPSQELNSYFKSVTSGTAEVMFTGIPPFQRFFFLYYV